MGAKGHIFNANAHETVTNAAEILGEEAKEIDPSIEKRVLRKIDMFMMPAMVIGYGLVYYDKVRSPSFKILSSILNAWLTDHQRRSWAARSSLE